MITPPMPARNKLEERLTHPEPASEEEQRTYDLIVGNAMKMMWGDQSDQVVGAIQSIGQSGKKPWEAVGQVGHLLLSGVSQRAITDGLNVNADIMLNAGAEIIEELMELGKSAGLFALTEDEYVEHQNKALQEAARLFAQDMGEDKEFDRGALAQEMVDLQEMQARGFDFSTLDEISEGPVEVQPRMNPITAGIRQGMS